MFLVMLSQVFGLILIARYPNNSLYLVSSNQTVFAWNDHVYTHVSLIHSDIVEVYWCYDEGHTKYTFDIDFGTNNLTLILTPHCYTYVEQVNTSRLGIRSEWGEQWIHELNTNRVIYRFAPTTQVLATASNTHTYAVIYTKNHTDWILVYQPRFHRVAMYPLFIHQTIHNHKIVGVVYDGDVLYIVTFTTVSPTFVNVIRWLPQSQYTSIITLTLPTTQTISCVHLDRHHICMFALYPSGTHRVCVDYISEMTTTTLHPFYCLAVAQ